VPRDKSERPRAVVISFDANHISPAEAARYLRIIPQVQIVLTHDSGILAACVIVRRPGYQWNFRHQTNPEVKQENTGQLQNISHRPVVTLPDRRNYNAFRFRM
jgi:hypothetical protein